MKVLLRLLTLLLPARGRHRETTAAVPAEYAHVTELWAIRPEVRAYWVGVLDASARIRP